MSLNSYPVNKLKPIYLDHNASTPIDALVLETLIRVSRDVYGNASSIEHGYGNLASREVEKAREIIAGVLGCRAPEIIFTSGSTESNNLAILGAFPNLKESGKTHIITSQIEHPSVLACFDYLEKNGARVTRLSVNEDGVVSLDEFKNELTENTGLVSIMAANNETGILQPVHEIGKHCEEVSALFHTDYSQATAYIPIDMKTSPIHMASFSGHKAYGPKGVGVLYRSLRNPRVSLDSIFKGGGQEKGLRSGTYNTPAIAALGTSFELIGSQIIADLESLSALRDTLQTDLIMKIPDLLVNGANGPRLPNTLSLSIKGIEPLALMQRMRDHAVFSASSACSSGKVDTSHVLKAMYGNTERAKTAFRIGLGRSNMNLDVERLSDLFYEACQKLKVY